MMPDLRRLFPTRRLWAGRGATIRGYGDKRTLVGIQVNGAGDVLTLGRTDKSGVTPSLGTDEEPVSLRAGPGVRLHGYGGIHTLERLPVEVEEVQPLKEAGLLIETQDRAGYARVCYHDVADPIIDGFVIARRITYTYSNGSFDEIYTASGDVFGFALGEDVPTCDPVEVDDTREDGFIYIDLQSISNSDTLQSGSVAAAAAAAEIADEGSVSGSELSWLEPDFRSASELERTIYLGISSSQLSFFVPGWIYRRPRYRLTNTGRVKIKASIAWTPDGEDPGGSGDLSSDIELARGQVSEWIDSPASSQEQFWEGRITRIRMGRWLSVA